MKYVQFVRGRYFVRMTVPPELREIVGKRELTENLGSDKKLAERKAHGSIAGFLTQLEDAREKLVANRPTLSSIAKSYYQEQMDIDDQSRIELGQDTVRGLNRGSNTIMATQFRLIASGKTTGEPAEEWLSELSHKISEAGIL